MKIIEAYQMDNWEIKPIQLEPFYQSTREWALLTVFDRKRNVFKGFGGAINESSAYNFSILSEDEKKQALEMLVGETGLGYNLFRLCIASSDFTLDSYSYVEENDFELKTFSIEKDKKWIIPFIKEIQKYSKRELTFFASPWAPPAFMKTNNDRKFGGKLKKGCYDIYSEYIIKFLKAYESEGIHISYLTIQNEPKASQTWESCTYTVEEEIALAKVLRKHLKEHNLEVKLLCWDHNKERLLERAVPCFEETELFNGAAYHWYSGNHYDNIQHLRNMYPEKELFETEFCRAYGVDVTFTSYTMEFVNNLRCGVNGIIEWCLILDEKGGPYHDRPKHGGCEGTIQIDAKNKIFTLKNYNETYMFAHFIKPGAHLLYTSSFIEDLKVSAVENPDGTIVVNIVNFLEELPVSPVAVRINDHLIDIPTPSMSVTTLVIDLED